MAQSVAACALAYDILSGGSQGIEPEVEVEADFIIPTNYGMGDLDPAVDAGFHRAVAIIKDTGFSVEEKPLAVLEELKTLPIWHFSAIESRGEYDAAFQTQRELMDPRVAGPDRMGRADGVDAVSYRKTLNQRQGLIEKYKVEMGRKILLMPTTPILPPSLASMADDEVYGRVNLQILRNPTIANVMDCCSISLPFQHDGATIGVMLTAISGHDISLLRLAGKVESVLA
jgi:aspartyl-tRNA(Asn)/glutamyl-tRNA(Gln) amidotransferase subunit A